jgi:hypothetical protein
MLRRALQIGLIFVLAGLIGIVTSNAQSLRNLGSYKAHIPYDFAIGNKTFQAGDYRLRLRRATEGNAAVFVALETPKGDVLNTVVGMNNWRKSSDDQAYLVFQRYGDNREIYALERIVSRNFGYSVRTPRTATSVKISKKLGNGNDTVALLLTRIE